jgi:hypothetical protein
VYDSFELVQQSSPKDGEIRVVHLHYIEGDVFRPWVSYIPEGYWKRDFPQSVDSFTSEAY